MSRLFRSVKFSIEADGKKHEEEGFLFVIANSGIVGSFNNVAAHASIDDGKFDLLLVKKCSLPELVALTAETNISISILREETGRFSRP